MVDFIRDPAPILYGTRGNDQFFMSATTYAVFGFGSTGRLGDIMYGRADAIRQEFYIDAPTPGPKGDFFGHPLPPGTTRAFLEKLWSTPHNWTVHVGEDDVVKVGYGHAQVVLHGSFAPYAKPTLIYGFVFDPRYHSGVDNDSIVVAHDRVDVSHVVGSRDGTQWLLKQADFHFISSDPHDPDQWARVNFGTDQRGPGVDRVTGAGDHEQHIPVETGDLTADTLIWAREHDHVTHPGGGDIFW